MTSEQQEQVSQLRRQGVCVAETAAELGVTPREVSNVFPPEDAEIVSDYTKSPNMSVKAICARHAIMTAQLYAILTRTGTPRRTGSESVEAASELAAAKVQQLNDAVERYQRGEKIRAIVFHTGISQPTLHAELKRRQISTRREAQAHVDSVVSRAIASKGDK